MRMKSMNVSLILVPMMQFVSTRSDSILVSVMLIIFLSLKTTNFKTQTILIFCTIKFLGRYKLSN